MSARGPVGVVALLVLLAAGCAHQPHPNSSFQGAAVENVPFFAQTPYQCGPAALAEHRSQSRRPALVGGLGKERCVLNGRALERVVGMRLVSAASGE